jgi:transposase InsO family protein
LKPIQTSSVVDLLVELTHVRSGGNPPATSSGLSTTATGQPVCYRGFSGRWRVTPSMSRKANPYDNALAESFVAMLKSECFANSLAPTVARAMGEKLATCSSRQKASQAV